MKKKTFFFLLIVSLVSLTGCFSDDLSNCPVDLHLYFESVMPKYTYEGVTNRLDLYLYNGMDVLADKYTYSKAELEAIDYRPVLPLGACDRYTLIALVNAESEYAVTGTEELHTFHVSLLASAGGVVRNKQANLFFARKEVFTKDVTSDTKCIYETLALYKNTNHLFVDITFESPVGLQLGELNTYLEGNNGSFNHQNKCHPVSNRVYLPHETNVAPGNANIQYSLTTMQLWIGSDLTLLVEEEQKELLRLRVMDYLSKVYDTDEKLDKEDMFYLNLVLKNDFTIVELKINGWYVIRSGVEV